MVCTRGVEGYGWVRMDGEGEGGGESMGREREMEGWGRRDGDVLIG